jgi:hypothetical protein
MKIILNLPGAHRTAPLPLGDYLITVTRADGYACNEIEAKTALQMLLPITKAPDIERLNS